MRERNCSDSKSRITVVTFMFLQLWLMRTASQPSLHSHEGFITRLLNETSVFNSVSNVMTYLCKGLAFILLLFMSEVTEYQPSVCSDSFILLTYILGLSGSEENTTSDWSFLFPLIILFEGGHTF